MEESEDKEEGFIPFPFIIATVFIFAIVFFGKVKNNHSLLRTNFLVGVAYIFLLVLLVILMQLMAYSGDGGALVFLFTMVGLIGSYIANVVFTCPYYRKVRKDAEFGPWIEEHKCMKCLIPSLSLFVSFHSSRLFYSRFLGFTLFSARMEQYEVLAKALNYTSLLHILLGLLPPIMASFIGLFNLELGYQLYITNIEMLLIAILLIILIAYEASDKEDPTVFVEEEHMEKLNEDEYGQSESGFPLKHKMSGEESMISDKPLDEEGVKELHDIMMERGPNFDNVYTEATTGEGVHNVHMGSAAKESKEYSCMTPPFDVEYLRKMLREEKKNQKLKNLLNASPDDLAQVDEEDEEEYRMNPSHSPELKGIIIANDEMGPLSGRRGGMKMKTESERRNPLETMVEYQYSADPNLRHGGRSARRGELVENDKDWEAVGDNVTPVRKKGPPPADISDDDNEEEKERERVERERERERERIEREKKELEREKEKLEREREEELQRERRKKEDLELELQKKEKEDLENERTRIEDQPITDTTVVQVQPTPIMEEKPEREPTPLKHEGLKSPQELEGEQLEMSMGVVPPNMSPGHSTSKKSPDGQDDNILDDSQIMGQFNIEDGRMTILQDSNGNLIDKYGRKVNKHGHLIDDEGNIINRHGQIVIPRKEQPDSESDKTESIQPFRENNFVKDTVEDVSMTGEEHDPNLELIDRMDQVKKEIDEMKNNSQTNLFHEGSGNWGDEAVVVPGSPPKNKKTPTQNKKKDWEEESPNGSSRHSDIPPGMEETPSNYYDLNQPITYDEYAKRGIRKPPVYPDPIESDEAHFVKGRPPKLHKGKKKGKKKTKNKEEKERQKLFDVANKVTQFRPETSGLPSNRFVSDMEEESRKTGEDQFQSARSDQEMEAGALNMMGRPIKKKKKPAPKKGKKVPPGNVSDREDPLQKMMDMDIDKFLENDNLDVSSFSNMSFVSKGPLLGQKDNRKLADMKKLYLERQVSHMQKDKQRKRQERVYKKREKRMGDNMSRRSQSSEDDIGAKIQENFEEMQDLWRRGNAPKKEGGSARKKAPPLESGAPNLFPGNRKQYEDRGSSSDEAGWL